MAPCKVASFFFFDIQFTFYFHAMMFQPVDRMDGPHMGGLKYNFLVGKLHIGKHIIIVMTYIISNPCNILTSSKFKLFSMRKKTYSLIPVLCSHLCWQWFGVACTQCKPLYICTTAVMMLNHQCIRCKPDGIKPSLASVIYSGFQLFGEVICHLDHYNERRVYIQMMTIIVCGLWMCFTNAQMIKQREFFFVFVF